MQDPKIFLTHRAGVFISIVKEMWKRISAGLACVLQGKLVAYPISRKYVNVDPYIDCYRELAALLA